MNQIYLESKICYRKTCESNINFRSRLCQTFGNNRRHTTTTTIKQLKSISILLTSRISDVKIRLFSVCLAFLHSHSQNMHPLSVFWYNLLFNKISLDSTLQYFGSVCFMLAFIRDSVVRSTLSLKKFYFFAWKFLKRLWIAINFLLIYDIRVQKFHQNGKLFYNFFIFFSAWGKKQQQNSHTIFDWTESNQKRDTQNINEK